MAGVADTLDLDQFAAWAASAAQRAQGADVRPAFKQIAVLLTSYTKQNFDGAHAPDGTAWPPLKMDRARGGGGQKPLRDTGLLMASAVSNGPGHVEEFSDEELTWGTNHEHASTHQEGATILPKSAKALAVPLTPEALRVPGPRQFPRPLFVVWKNGASSGALAEVRGKQLVFQFALLPKAVIPPRPFIGINDDIAEGCENILGDWFEREVAGL